MRDNVTMTNRKAQTMRKPLAILGALAVVIFAAVGSVILGGGIAGATPTAVAYMNAGRAQTGLPPVPYTEAQIAGMGAATAFVLAVNDERTVRGLPAFVQSTAVSALVQNTGINTNADPTCIQSYNCLGRVWAGLGSSGPEAVMGVFEMVYRDGWRGATTVNADCHYTGTVNCTGHRRVLLQPVGSGNAGLMDAVCTPARRTFDGTITDGSCAALEWQVPTSQLYMTAYYQSGGMWQATSTGAIYTAGTAPYYGSMAGQHLNAPIIGIVATPDGGGYWLLGSDGGIFSFGDAAFYGSTGGMTLNAPVVGMAVTSDGHGYWLVASDGGIFAFGDAPFLGSMGGQPLNRPVVTMAATSSGYYLMASDGGLFAFDVPFDGSTGGQWIPSPMVGLFTTPTGYDEVTATGTNYVF